jgi:hypothetical protein
LVEPLYQLPLRELGVTFAPDALRAALVMIDGRIRDLGRAVRNVIDPSLIWSKENASMGEPDHGETDLIIRGWSPKDRVRHLRRELRMAKGRLRLLRHRKTGKGATS